MIGMPLTVNPALRHVMAVVVVVVSILFEEPTPMVAPVAAEIDTSWLSICALRALVLVIACWLALPT